MFWKSCVHFGLKSITFFFRIHRRTKIWRLKKSPFKIICHWFYILKIPQPKLNFFLKQKQKKYRIKQRHQKHYLTLYVRNVFTEKKKTRPLTFKLCGLLNVFQIHCSALMMSADECNKKFLRCGSVVVNINVEEHWNSTFEKATIARNEHQ